MNELIYNFNEHGLYSSDNKRLTQGRTILFVIDTVQIDCSYTDGKVISVYGYLPLVKADRGRIITPTYSLEEYRVEFPRDSDEYVWGVGYDYFDNFPDSEKYFVTDVNMNDRTYKRILTKIKYDEENKIILLGTMNGSEKAIEINRNIIFGFDEKENLKFICIILDKVIKD